MSPGVVDPKKIAEINEAKRRYDAGRKSEVKLRVLDFKIRRTDQTDPLGVSNALVLTQPAEGKSFPKKIVITSLGGDEGANCGKASSLFEAASTSRDMTASIGRDANGTYYIMNCLPVKVDDWQ
ncbi:hypothetical protein D1O30_11640 [Methylocystis hirsuta]|uniref:Uncharacterized protein n=1 Tax=Methylocystis hirsuta TaxID=369798 RepID=A0A3M9XSR4_9HYPH|nr:hypothetical protein D1O30_11640 [Methylocystis hirsuta]